MRTTFKIIIVIFLAALTFHSCQDQDDIAAPSSLQINDFIWKGMNLYYLWQADVPNLSDTKFANQQQLNAFLYGYSKPEILFDDLRVNKSIDRFSWIESDYTKLEGLLQGTTDNNGVDFGLSYMPGSTTNIFGWVRYIIPNSDASAKNIKRGDFFTGVNDTQLTLSNYEGLLFGSNSNYILNMADLNAEAIIPNGKTVALTKTVLDENPIFINKVIISGSHKIGYLMYNGFYANYDTQLNDAFGSLKNQGITDFVLDLRYNSGGSVQTAALLASMITGQYTGKIFAKQQWNSKIERYFNTNDPGALLNLFTDKIGTTPINSLNLTKVYILTTKSTASASELIVNGLKPYMEVVQIGDITVGKNVGSVTLYDSPDFGKDNRNPNHKYAMQPIVLKITNASGFGDYYDGLTPTYQQKETLSTLGILGDTTEPYLYLAIGKITGTGKMKQSTPGFQFDDFKDVKSIIGQNQMYLDKAPEGLLKALE